MIGLHMLYHQHNNVGREKSQCRPIVILVAVVGMALMVMMMMMMYTSNTAGRSVASLARIVCWLLNVPATGLCISGTDLLRQFYMLPH